MWGIKQKSKLSIVVYLTIHVLAATLVFGCENRKSFYDVNGKNIDQAPMRMENPEDPIPDMMEQEEPIVVDLDQQASPDDDTNLIPPAPPAAEPVKEQPKKTEPVVQQKPRTPERPAKEQPKTEEPKAKSEPSVTKPTSVGEASRFIKVAYWVVQNEAKKIGTPCNFYVSRVLELTGYSDDGFLANDFDIYAKKHFSSYKDEKFVTTNLQAERLRLKRHLWSYPSRTPFILQWERQAPKPGHIAIVERIGDQLVIYQASLNRHIARREQTTIDRLLSASRAPRMTVYSEYVAR
ncbi:hypothetical protein [Pseudobdellovibrio sp. HCB154]|uniref:hypothetical protein n=1 Tax=Pseudobdellovibrio sp. HCB154 TaxID=3386277 RepID=UPI003916EC34